MGAGLVPKPSPGHSPCGVLKCCSKQSAVVDVLCTVRHQIQRRSIALAVWRDIKQNQKIILRSRSTSIHGHEQHKGTLADWKALFLNRFCTALCEPILAEGSQQTCAPGLSRALCLSGMLLGAGLVPRAFSRAFSLRSLEVL